MGYSVEKVSGNAASQELLAEFLAHFVQDGELLRPLEGDDDPAVWKKRFSWWWDDNPFCSEESPRGFILFHEGEMVGFSGYIPMDYETAGSVVPALVATTFFIREAHRTAAIGMLSRQRALGRDYHIVDSSPSPEMRQILEKLDYEHADDRRQYYFPMIGWGGLAGQKLLKEVGLSIPLPSQDGFGARSYLATQPAEVDSIPPFHDGMLRRRVTHESLEWLCQAGSRPRSFFGLCDPNGKLIAYAIGIYRRKFGLCACLLDDYVDFRPKSDGLGHLIRVLMEDPIGSGLDRDTDALAISFLGGGVRPTHRGLKRESIFYYHLPEGVQSDSKYCLPIEGDIALI